jgi:predicted RNA-binding protein associated with RNAse of E/G family
MERKFADRPNWNRIKEKDFFVKKDTDIFDGFIAFLNLKRVEKPLWKDYNNHSLKIVDNDYWWIQFFPKNENYVVTTMINEEGSVVQWYIDICKSHGMNENGIPWFDDLYLDVVLLPSGYVQVLDEEEIDLAVRNGTISNQEYDLAYKTVFKITENVQVQMDTLLKWFQMINSELFQSK